MKSEIPEKKRRWVGRGARVVVVLVLTGALLNVAAAWWCMVGVRWAKLGATERRTVWLPRGTAVEPWGFGDEARGLGLMWSTDPGWVSGVGTSLSLSITHHVGAEVAGASYLGSDDRGGVPVLGPVWCAGWPMRSLRCWGVVNGEGKWEWRGGLWSGARWETPLPVGVIPAGFAASTAVYGAVSGVIAMLPRVIVRAVRRRAGRCVGCGYEVGELGVCPECGLQRKS